MYQKSQNTIGKKRWYKFVGGAYSQPQIMLWWIDRLGVTFPWFNSGVMTFVEVVDIGWRVIRSI